MRHLATFLLFFVSLICFYKIGRDVFKNPWLGLLGTVFLVLSPRIFADAFYNSKDLGFLSGFIIAIYSLFRYLDRPNWRRAAVHALVSAWLINIRLAGLLAPFFTLVFIGIDLIKPKSIKSHNDQDKKSGSLFLYGYLVIILTILFWPILWENPIYHFIQALKMMAHYPWQGEVLYMGQ